MMIERQCVVLSFLHRLPVVVSSPCAIHLKKCVQHWFQWCDHLLVLICLCFVCYLRSMFVHLKSSHCFLPCQCFLSCCPPGCSFCWRFVIILAFNPCSYTFWWTIKWIRFYDLLMLIDDSKYTLFVILSKSLSTIMHLYGSLWSQLACSVSHMWSWLTSSFSTAS